MYLKKKEVCREAVVAKRNPAFYSFNLEIIIIINVVVMRKISRTYQLKLTLSK